MASADDFRQKGNFEFGNGNFDAALQFYSLALDASTDDPTMQVLNLCNRSACYHKMEEYEFAKQDAQQALMIDPNNLKAAFRLGKTLVALNDFEAAKTIVQKALEQIDTMEKEEHSNSTPPDDHKQTITLSDQRKSFQDLWNHCLQAALIRQQRDSAPPERSIKHIQRPLSIKEFSKGPSLGSGNFTEVLIATHTITHERFALKCIEKKQAADLAKRQHPNVWNEIQMERRVLLERLPSTCPYIIKMYHVFQDYTTLYYVMDLHTEWGDLWSELRMSRWNSKDTTIETGGSRLDVCTQDEPAKITRFMVGCHASQGKVWLWEILSALEHMHKHGIVHRDLKPENILLNKHGHVVVIDFGTAKDLIQTDLNGPEFVGTPDFMSPEAVEGDSSTLEKEQDVKNKREGALHTSDLWAFGAIMFILQTGHTPFWCPSPYLAFLRIKRCNLLRAPGIVDDDCWNLISKLMKREPPKRIGADAFKLKVGGLRSVEAKDGGYNEIRNHPYFDSIRNDPPAMERTPVPSLRDLCLRAVAELAHKDSLDVELCDKYPPGDGSTHDMMRLKPIDRAAVMHVLERMRLLRDPRVYARFFTDPFACRIDKIRPATRDFIGLTQMTDDQGKAPKAMMNDPYATPIDTGGIQFVHITNPLFVQCMNESCSDVTRKEWITLLKKAISVVNRKRPKLVVVTGFIDDKCRKLLSRISETIAVVCHDGSTFFSFWLSGVQSIAVQSSTDAVKEESEQMTYLREQLEQCRMSKHPLFLFVDSDPRNLPKIMLKRLARGRALGLYGVTDKPAFQTEVSYEANTKVDDESVKSTSSDEDNKDESTMLVHGTNQNALRWITVNDEPGDWTEEQYLIDAEGNERHLTGTDRQGPLAY